MILALYGFCKFCLVEFCQSYTDPKPGGKLVSGFTIKDYLCRIGSHQTYREGVCFYLGPAGYL